MSEVKKKILITTGLFPPEIGGPATYSKLLLAELPARGFAVTVLPFSTVRHLPPIIRHLIYTFKVIQLGYSVDIIYAQDPVSVGLPTALANLFLGKKFILKIVGDYAWEQGTQRFGVTDRLDDFAGRRSGYRLPVRILKAVQSWVARAADRIIVPSEYLKVIVSQWSRSGDLAAKIKVIYNAFDPVEIRESREDLRSEFGFIGPTIISAGRLVPWKGFPLLINLVRDLRVNYPELKLLIVGSGPDEEKLRQQIVAEGLTGAVELTGQLARRDLLCRVKAADIFALNTGYEGLSHQLLEVMSLGTPIITTPVGGNPELITNGKTGSLAAFNNREEWRQILGRLLADPTLAESMAQRAQVFASENFNQEKMINQLIAEII